MPEYCDDCRWYECRPHPMKGWTESCALMNQCMDDDQPDEWIYDGNGRPKACPLIKAGETLFSADNARKFLKDNPPKGGKE